MAMEGNYPALTLDELTVARAAIRVIRYISVVAAAMALPVLIVLATPLVGWTLLAAILFSPLILAYVLFTAARQAEAERHRARS
jgi:hypothetical protein